MIETDKKEIKQIFNNGIEQLILPHFDNIYRRFDDIDKKFTENQKQHQDLSDSIDTIDRKLNAEIQWRDDASKRLKKVEVKLGFAK